MFGGSLSKLRKASAAGFKVDSTTTLEEVIWRRDEDTNLYGTDSAQKEKVKMDPIDSLTCLHLQLSSQCALCAQLAGLESWPNR